MVQSEHRGTVGRKIQPLDPQRMQRGAFQERELTRVLPVEVHLVLQHEGRVGHEPGLPRVVARGCVQHEREEQDEGAGGTPGCSAPRRKFTMNASDISKEVNVRAGTSLTAYHRRESVIDSSEKVSASISWRQTASMTKRSSSPSVRPVP